MCWLDKVSTKNILFLRDRFSIKQFVETGTAEGDNALFYAQHFEDVWTCEIDKALCEKAKQRAGERYRRHIFFCNQASPEFLLQLFGVSGGFRQTTLFFLDAHTPDNWPILEELKVLKGFKNCCIIIHDFKVPGLGHIQYGVQALDMEYVKDGLLGVNPNFCFYSNYKGGTCIYTPEEVQAGIGLPWDAETQDRLKYTWSSPEKTHRGILYATPEPLVGPNETLPMGMMAYDPQR